MSLTRINSQTGTDRRLPMRSMPMTLVAALCLYAVAAAGNPWTARAPVKPTGGDRTPAMVSGQGTLTTYASLAEFTQATEGFSIATEDFSGRPSNSVSPCYEPVNHRLGQPGTNFLAPVCFEPGRLIPGFSLRSNLGYGGHGFGTMAFGADTVGLSFPVVGAMSPATTLLVDFVDKPVAVAMDAWDWQAGSPLTFTVLDEDDALVGTFQLFPPAPNQPVFAGFTSDVPIRRVTVSGAAGASQMISSLHFGGVTGSVAADADRLAFEAIAIGDTAVRTVTLVNMGDTPFSIDDIAEPALPFSLDSDGCSGQVLPRAGECAVSVRFSPVVVRDHAVAWQPLSDDGADPSSPIDIALAGRGAIPTLTASASALDFGTVDPGQVELRTVDLKVVGAVPVRLEQLDLEAGPFQIVAPSCPTPVDLEPGDACTVTVRFAPGSPAASIAQLHAVSDDPSSPLSVQLAGNNADAIFVDGFELPAD